MIPSVDLFKPAFGLGNPHLQTLWGPLWRPTTHIERQRERLWLDDGDFLDLDWHGPHDAQAPLVLVLHGLTGSSNSPYVAGLQKALASQGWASAALNWRGCSGEPNLLARSYHSGASEDLAAAIAHLRTQRPLAPLYAVGYSLGAMCCSSTWEKPAKPPGCKARRQCRCRFGWINVQIASGWAFRGFIKSISCARCWRISASNRAGFYRMVGLTG